MNVIYIISLFFYFIDYIFSYPHLQKRSLSNGLRITITYDVNETVKFNLVEFFNPFEPFYYLDGSYVLVNQKSFIYKNYKTAYNVIELKPSVQNQYIWIRSAGVINLVPGGETMNPNVNIESGVWSISLKAKQTSVIINDIRQCCYNITYSLYAISIYPAANTLTWSSAYENIKKNKVQIVFNAINASLDSEYFQQNAALLYSTNFESGPVEFTLANRQIRDFLLFIVANGPNNTQIQYPPVYIKGCLSMENKDKSCKLLQKDYPMYIVLGCAIAFFFLALKYDVIHILICGWITCGFIALVIWRSVISNLYFRDSILYIIGLAIGPSFGIIFAVMIGTTTKKYNRLRVFFIALLIGMILVSIMWFTPLKIFTWNNKTLFITVSIVVAVIIIVLLSFCNYLTMKVGTVFITSVLICLSVSINNLNASIIPFIFIDFYNSIIFGCPKWIYYSPMLTEDLIIVILCPIVSLIVGLVFYSSLKKSRVSKRKQILQQTRTIDDRDNIELDTSNVNITIEDHRTPIMEPNIQILVLNDLPPSYVQLQQPSTDIPSQLPPSYEQCLKIAPLPTAPMDNIYNGPCTD